MAFKGGYRFSRFEGRAEPLLLDSPLPETVTIPVDFDSLRRFSVLVNDGDKVKAGRPLMTSEDGTTVACPVNGTVSRIMNGAITIVSDGTADVAPLPEPAQAPGEMALDNLLTLFASTGCSLLIPKVLIDRERCRAMRRVIVNAVHNLPTGTSFDPAIFGGAEMAGDGLRVLGALFPNAEAAVAINRRNAPFFNDPAIRDRASVHVMSDRYPQERYELLARDIAGERLIASDGTRNDTIILLEYTDLIQIAETLTRWRPLIDRIILLAGPGVIKPAWYRIRIGTPFAWIRQQHLKTVEDGPWRIIRGDLFTGTAVDDPDAAVTPVDREIAVIREHKRRNLFRFLTPGSDLDAYPIATLAAVAPILPKKLDSGVHGGERFCVQCNYCDAVCPIDTYPHLIWKNVTTDNIEGSFKLRPQDCIGCRLCDYVCPSRMDISGAVERAKAARRESGEAQ